VTNSVSQFSSAQQQALYDMMNGDAISGADGTSPTATDGSSPPAYLTPEALMVYCQTRLQGIDSQVQTAMTSQQNTNWEQGQIAGILSELSTDSADTTNGVMNNPQECKTIEQNLENLITQIQAKDPGCSQLGQLEQLHDSIMATGTGPYQDASGLTHGFYYGGDPAKTPTGLTTPPGDVSKSGADNTISTDEFTNFTNTLNNINSSLSSGAEMGMINIQSLMSDRTTAIQLTTSILQSYDDGVEKIADNIGK